MVRPDGRQVTAPEVPNVNVEVVVVIVVVQLVMETVEVAANNLWKNDRFFLSSQSASSSLDESITSLLALKSFFIRPEEPAKRPMEGAGMIHQDR